jgi:hypothetical protein
MKEGEMLQIPVRRAFVKGALLALVTLGVGSCNHRCDCARVLNLHPNDKPLDTIKKQKLVPCDTDINVDLKTGGVNYDAAYVCPSDQVTWHIDPPHKFKVEFKTGSPFDKDSFTEKDATRTVQSSYTNLQAYKYSIQVDSLKAVDPQVIGGGNP